MFVRRGKNFDAQNSSSPALVMAYWGHSDCLAVTHVVSEVAKGENHSLGSIGLVQVVFNCVLVLLAIALSIG